MAPSTSFARSTGSTYSFSTSTSTRAELLHGGVGRVAAGCAGPPSEGGRAGATREGAHARAEAERSGDAGSATRIEAVNVLRGAAGRNLPEG